MELSEYNLNLMGKHLYINYKICTLFVPGALNCLMLLSQIDHGGGSVDFKDGMCWIKNGDKTIRKGYKSQRLYLLHARAILTEGEGKICIYRKVIMGPVAPTLWTHFNISTPNAQKVKIGQWTKYRSIIDPIKRL